VPVKTKICGITNLEDAQAAVELGADALGFNFYRKSPRYIEPERARSLIEWLPPLVSIVGVFVDERRPEQVVEIARATGLGTVQLHGSESPDYTRQIRPLPVFKAFGVGAGFELERLAAFPVQAFLLDTGGGALPGGTGKTFDWDLALAAKRLGRVILAGGLNPENVFEAICRVQPYGIDVCSGIEREPGRKDHRKMAALFDEIHRARRELRPGRVK
jgi:phosphoribosylanthranilate isomerase